ncbi:MAG: YaiI/YqxD family protein [Bacteriovoracaceae bacterium]
MLHVYIDADGCPVKEEVYRVAGRHKLPITLVANKAIKIPNDPSVKMVVVKGNFDAADDWIVENVQKNDIVITADILLAERCVKKEARVVGHKGLEFTEENIGSLVASRELMQHLRQLGEGGNSSRPLEGKDKSEFLQTLERVIQSLKRLKV